ncbi:MAG: hypothetical protein N2049_11545 [Anaerolineales bacterium]|nr:hypothetical protein [Anaerolineales bacterium]MCX7609832.1 hypothetical protein [Anaerolineales bacterium]MDW8226487.1 hypothetical protein [Anaerolineales bacterium]
MLLFLVFVGILLLGGAILLLFEYRLRQPDMLVLYERRGKIALRTGRFYPRHFSLALRYTPYPLQLSMEATAAGNLGVRVKLIGSVAPAVDRIDALIRVGGWNEQAVARAVEETVIFLQELIKEYAERFEIHALSSTNLLQHLKEQAGHIRERYGLEIVTLAVQTLEAVDPSISEALRQQEQARLLEQTERLNQQARAAAAEAKARADEEIMAREHALEMKRMALSRERLEAEESLAHQRLTYELERGRMRLEFEKEELQALASKPELLLLTPQAARLAEASQSLKNARTIVSLTPQDLARGQELLDLFQAVLRRALEEKQQASDQSA